MITMETRETPNLQLKGARVGVDYAARVTLTGREYQATRTPSFYDYQKMIEACCAAAAPMTEDLFRKNYRAWLFLVGAPLNEDRRRRFTSYSLARPAQDKKLINGTKLEKVFKYQDLERTAGLYPLDREKFCDALLFLTINSWASLVLSDRNDFLSDYNLNQMYQAATSDTAPTALVAMNWEKLALALCPRGDVIVKTWGSFDDVYRNIMFIFAPEILVI
jgi:hypothetical protein